MKAVCDADKVHENGHGTFWWPRRGAPAKVDQLDEDRPKTGYQLTSSSAQKIDTAKIT